MRWHIIRVLLHKEILRQAANRGAIALAALLVVAALLLAFFSNDGRQLNEFPGGIDTCYVDYWQDSDWVQHLRAHLPPDLEPRVQFRHASQATQSMGRLVYPHRSGAIQMRMATGDDGRTETKIWIWYPDRDGAAIAPFETWFWRESTCFFQQQAATGDSRIEGRCGESSEAPPVEHERSHLNGAFDMLSSVTTGLVLFALFFSCVYLLPSLMCEERERGVLLAQALSPASAGEILAAKFLFYPALGIALAGLLAGILRPVVLGNAFFWLAVSSVAVGALGIGLTIACLARTQRTASMGALCYMLIVALFLFICQHGEIPFLTLIALEYHGPRMLHAALSDAVLWQHWGNLLATALLAAAWCALATFLFRRRGWQ